jgi:hypothetical protein
MGLISYPSYRLEKNIFCKKGGRRIILFKEL